MDLPPVISPVKNKSKSRSLDWNMVVIKHNSKEGGWWKYHFLSWKGSDFESFFTVNWNNGSLFRWSSTPSIPMTRSHSQVESLVDLADGLVQTIGDCHFAFGIQTMAGEGSGEVGY